MKESWLEIQLHLEKCVVEGRHDEVKKQFNDISLKKIPREFSAKFAELAWRSSLPMFALKILHPVIYPEVSFATPANDFEKINYASALINLGALDEAMQIFNSINPENEPEVLLRKSFAHFKKWNYQTAVPLLKSYIEHPKVSSYKKIVGKVNLVAAMIERGNWDEVDNLLAELKKECLENSYLLLLGNCFELQAQSHIFQSRFSEAIALLEESQKILEKQNGSFSLFVEKWTAICNCFLKKNSIDRLRSVKEKALALGNWETIRECDLFEAIILKDEDLIQKVILGTPHTAYRQRARQLSQMKTIARGNYYLTLGNPNQITKNFDPYLKSASGEPLFKTRSLLALFQALTQDFYKPCHVGFLFQNIYPNEKFNPFTSPNRVLTLIRRLDEWFIENQAPLRVHFKKSEFSIKAADGFHVRVLVQRAKSLSKADGHFLQIKTNFAGRSFSVASIVTQLKMSRTSARALIAEALAKGQINQISDVRPATYQISTSVKKKVAA